MLRHTIGVSTILFVSYGVVFVFGILGNIFLLVTFFKTPSLRTTTNIFIGNLAVADLLITLFCIPFTLASNLLSVYPFGAAICKLIAYVQAVAINAAVNSLVAISIDRYCSISKPFGFVKQRKKLIALLVIIWLFPILYMTPWLIVFKVKTMDKSEEYKVCAEFWKCKKIKNAYFITVNLFLSYLIPLFIITIFYIMMYVKINSRKIPGELCPVQRKILNYKSKIKIIKMILIIIITFAISWLPLYVLFVIAKFLDYPDSEIIYFQFLFPAAQWLATSNSCINPIIYTCYSRKFRNEFQKILNNIYLFRKIKPKPIRECIFEINHECILLSSSEIT